MNDSHREGTVWDEGKGQLLMIPVWKWFCNWKPLVTPPHYSRTVYTARPGEQLVNQTELLQVQLQFLILCTISLIPLIYLLIDWFLMDEWIAETNRILGQHLQSLPPAQRDYCVLTSLMVPQLFGCLCVFEQPTLTNRSQCRKTLNCFTMLQIITMTTSTALKEKRDSVAGVETLQRYRNLSNEAVFSLWDMGY